jgi:flagellar protein FlaG
LNDFLTPTQTSLKFEFHDKLNEYYVTLVDEKTKEVVKEIPSKKMLDFYAAMTEFIGVMMDKKI